MCMLIEIALVCLICMTSVSGVTSAAHNNYCEASFPLPELNHLKYLGDEYDTYNRREATLLRMSDKYRSRSPSSFTVNKHLLRVFIITRHGDRAPCNVLFDDDSLWNECNIDETSTHASSSFHLNKIGDEESESPWARINNRREWKGNCEPGDLTSKGL